MGLSIVSLHGLSFERIFVIIKSLMKVFGGVILSAPHLHNTNEENRMTRAGNEFAAIPDDALEKKVQKPSLNCCKLTHIKRSRFLNA